MITINRIYTLLRKKYGPQGWWPMLNRKTLKGEYHTNAPRNKNQAFEIALGAILTQNVSWSNVVMALGKLAENGLLSCEALVEIDREELGPYIRSTGYYNEKAKKVKNFLEWYAGYGYSFSNKKLVSKEPGELRDELLTVKGIGPETADSMLLYAMRKKFFVVDAYTRRVLSRIGILSGNEKYQEIQDLFHKKFKGDIKDYNEYHALIVIHCIKACSKKPNCDSCCLESHCEKRPI
ncbi:MAG: hypothetical protein GY754_34475 [bacterium]|nr:hypothetical protein [bacterium]